MPKTQRKSKKITSLINCLPTTHLGTIMETDKETPIYFE